MSSNRNTSAGSDDSSVIRNDMRHSRRGFLKGIVCGTLAALVAPGIREGPCCGGPGRQGADPLFFSFGQYAPSCGDDS